MHHAAHDFEILHFANVGFDSRFEEVDTRGTLLVGVDLFAACVVHFGHFVDKRYHIAQEFHEASHAHVLSCADTEDGEDAARDQSFANALTHFIFGELFGLKELFHQAFIVLCRSFHQGFVHGLRLLEFLCGDVFHDRFSSLFFPREFLHEDHVDEAVECRSGGERILHRNHFRAVNIAQIVEDQFVVAVFMVELVDEKDDGFAEFLGIAEVVLRSHLDAECAVEE